MRSSFLAWRNKPYWSCIINAQLRNVMLSIPRSFSISACVSTILSLERFSQSVPPSCNWERFNVGFPDFVLVRTTRKRFTPISNTNSIEPLLASSVPRIQALLSPSLVSSKRQSTIASMKRLLFPAPFTPLIVQNEMSEKSKLSSL